MGCFLNNSNLQATFCQIFSHFKPDKACTNNDSFFWMIVQGCHDFIEIGNIAKSVGVLSFYQAFNGRNKWFSSWGEDQLVVAFCEFLSIVSHSHSVLCWGNTDDLVKWSHIQIKACLETFRSLDQ